MSSLDTNKAKVRSWLTERGYGGLALTAVVLLVVFPLVLDSFRLNMVGKYLTYAFPAVGLALCWGRTGVLSLGQGVFFGLGGYAMAMFLKLEASDPASTAIQSTPGIPDFMDWNQLTALPAFWVPFNSLAFALFAVVALPGVLAFIVSWSMFKRRVGGVYFAIITQAIASILSILIIGQQGYTGGVNGITDLRTLMGWGIRTEQARLVLYYVNAVLLLGCVVLSKSVLDSKLGRLLQGGTGSIHGLRRRGVEGLRLRIRGVYRRRRGCHVYAAGRLHVAVFRGHRAVDRDGDHDCRRWS